MAFVIRGLPELLSGPYPVGYDLLAGYAPSIQALPEIYPLKLFGWLESSLSVFALWFFWKISQTSLSLFLKIAGPAFYGLFVSSFYYLLHKGFKWSKKKSFFTALLFLLQPAVLRTGWDQLREMLGFVFLFVLFAKIECDILKGISRKSGIFILFSILVVLSHQLVSILFFVVILWQLIKTRGEKNLIVVKSWLVLFPSAFIFVLQLYFAYFANLDFGSRFTPVMLPSGTGFFAFTNYFLSDPRFVGGNFFTIIAYVGSLSLYVVLPLIPVAVKGFFKDKVVFPVLVWLLVSSYSIILFPWFAFSNYWWWILLLPIPLTIYAGHFLEKVGFITGRKHSKKIAFSFLLLGIIAVSYATSVSSIGYPFAYSYMPPGLVSSCVDFGDIPDIKTAFSWVNVNMPYGGTVVIPERLQGFAIMYARQDLKVDVIQPLVGLQEALSLLRPENRTVYAIYDESNLGNYQNVTRILVKYNHFVIYEIYF